MANAPAVPTSLANYRRLRQAELAQPKPKTAPRVVWRAVPKLGIPASRPRRALGLA